jgi:hypothetical protein
MNQPITSTQPLKSGVKSSESIIQPIPHLEAQIREIFARVVYSHKTHEKCADVLQGRHGVIVISQIILSALTTTSLLYALFGEQKVGTIIGAVLSTILLALNTYTKDKDINDLVERHSTTAKALLVIREKFLSLLTDMASGSLTHDEVTQKRDALEESLQSIYKTAPRTNSVAYKSAQDALQKNEDLTFTDEEIDAFLPTPLKRTKS